jgi:hypothetical protein
MKYIVEIPVKYYRLMAVDADSPEQAAAKVGEEGEELKLEYCGGIEEECELRVTDPEGKESWVPRDAIFTDEDR